MTMFVSCIKALLSSWLLMAVARYYSMGSWLRNVFLVNKWIWHCLLSMKNWLHLEWFFSFLDSEQHHSSFGGWSLWPGNVQKLILIDKPWKTSVLVHTKIFFVLGQDELSAMRMSLLSSSAKSSLGSKQCLNGFQQGFCGAVRKKLLLCKLEECVQHSTSSEISAH